MYIEIDLRGESPGPALCEPDDFKGFKVLVLGAGAGEPAVTRALAALGRVEDSGDALLRIDAVKDLAGERATEGAWVSQFDSMVDFARSKGWTDEAGTSIRAHCEFAEARG